jgi:hypothetical protein
MHSPGETFSFSPEKKVFQEGEEEQIHPGVMRIISVALPQLLLPVMDLLRRSFPVLPTSKMPHMRAVFHSPLYG